MKRSELSVIIFSVYLVIVGLAITLAPDFSLSIFDLPPSQDEYVRIIGIFLVYLSYFYFMSGWRKHREFMWLSVYARWAVILYFIAFAFLDWLSWKLIIFGFIDLAAGLWTYFALKSEEKQGN